jgi:hypothetical protein
MIAGVVLDTWRDAGHEKQMTAEQVRLRRKIMRVEGWSPLHSFWQFGCCLLLSAGVAWVVAVVGGS